VQRALTCGRAGVRIIALLVLAFDFAGCAVPGLLIPEGNLLQSLYLRGAPDVPVVALTFDDGPNGKCTAEVLDALAEVGAPATFFVLGTNVDAGGNDELLARMLREGHTIGLHGYNHEGRMMVLPRALRSELRDATRAVEAALDRAGVRDPRPPLRFFRPPFGFLTDGTADAAVHGGFAIVLWTISVGDWRHGVTAEDIVERILDRVGPGDVIVLHDGFRTQQRSCVTCTDRRVVADAVRLLVPRLVDRGLRPAPLAEVLRLPADASATTPR
jgi:peptidoglycan/xylan/chitin deacetylase (PgdA/CDA1 family)